eukprot:245800_1
MTDTWEDSWEDFDLGDKDASQIPGDSAESVGVNGKGEGLAWDDEEELSEGEEYAASAGISKKMQAKVMAQSRNSEAARIAAKHETSLLANENPEERRLRERARVEETEQALAAELLGEKGIANVSISGEKAAAGIEGMNVKTLQEHVELAIDIALKLRETNNSDNITVFLQEVISRLQKSISLSQVGFFQMLLPYAFGNAVERNDYISKGQMCFRGQKGGKYQEAGIRKLEKKR